VSWGERRQRTLTVFESIGGDSAREMNHCQAQTDDTNDTLILSTAAALAAAAFSNDTAAREVLKRLCPDAPRPRASGSPSP